MYCNKLVKPNSYNIHRDNDGIYHWVVPTFCDCELEQKEIKLKNVLRNGLTELDKCIDVQFVNRKTYNEKIKRLKEEFECEDKE